MSMLAGGTVGVEYVRESRWEVLRWERAEEGRERLSGEEHWGKATEEEAEEGVGEEGEGNGKADGGVVEWWV